MTNEGAIWGFYYKEPNENKDQQAALKFTGELKWISDHQARGWIKINEGQSLCPCKCKVLDFYLEASKDLYFKKDFLEAKADHLYSQLAAKPFGDPERNELFRQWIDTNFDLTLENNHQKIADGIFGKNTGGKETPRPDLISSRCLPHTGSGYFFHKDCYGRLGYSLSPDNEMYINEIYFLEPESTANLLKKDIFILPTPAQCFKRLAVLTVVGNEGTYKLVLCNKGHSALVINNTAYSFEEGGWKTFSPPQKYICEREKRPIVVQEISTHDDWFYPHDVETEAAGVSMPWYALLYLPFSIPIIPFDLAFRTAGMFFDEVGPIFPFFFPGGMCSDQSVIALNINGGKPLLTPFDVFNLVKEKLPVTQTYFVSGKCETEHIDNPGDKAKCYNNVKNDVSKWMEGLTIDPAPSKSILNWQ